MDYLGQELVECLVDLRFVDLLEDPPVLLQVAEDGEQFVLPVVLLKGVVFAVRLVVEDQPLEDVLCAAEMIIDGLSRITTTVCDTAYSHLRNAFL